MSAALRSSPDARRTLGRFELRRRLGQGAQATVWLARDARLDRDVALKLLAPGTDSTGDDRWLHEARTVGRLTHPHIVPVFDADVHDGQRYLVFELVDGPTLLQHLRQRGALPAHEAATLMLGVLDALHAAHAAGIVHRDLKPSNILLDAQGRARVMDFGIAAPIASVRDSRICGTPGYMSPEAARGAAPTPAMDVFAAGMTFALMLTGTPLIREVEPLRAIARVLQEDFELPADAPVDDTLRTLVRRALARDPAQRLPSVQDFHQALGQWLQPAPDSGGESGDATLEFLLRRMRHKADFPALSESVARIQRLSQSDHENLGKLTDEILKDVALTHKLMRLVNSAHYVTAGPVTTVSRAVALVGMSGIGNMAISLILLDRMQDRSHAAQLKEHFLQALLAGMLARELSAGTRDGEKAYLAALFQNLGRLLTEFYFPEEAQQIRALLQAPPAGSVAAPPDPDTAAQRVLGIRFDDLGQGVARHWGLPDSLQRAMRRPRDEAGGTTGSAGPAGTPPAALDPAERLRRLGGLCNAVSDTLLEPGDPAPRVADIAQRRGRALGISEKALQEATEHARRQLADVATAMHLQPSAASPAARLLGTPPAPGPTHPPGSARGAGAGVDAAGPKRANAAAAGNGAPALIAGTSTGTSTGTSPASSPDGLGGLSTEAAHAIDDATLMEAAPASARGELLAAGIQDISSQMVAEPFQLNLVLRMVLETMLRGLGFRRVVFALRDPRTETLAGKLGLGDGADRVSAALKVPLRLATGTAPDLFTAVCLKGADTWISDAAAVAPRLPAWHAREAAAGAFLLLPMQLKGTTFALLYADCARSGDLTLDDQALRQLRTLRNQAVMAFKQAN